MKSTNVSVSDLIPIVIEHLELNQDVEIKVSGHSMLPFFRHLKTIVKLRKEITYRKYDVVLAKYENQYILHRVISVKQNTYILRGDGAFRKEIVDKSDVFGRVVSFHTQGKKSKAYQFKVRLWLFFYPLRSVLLKFVRK